MQFKAIVKSAEVRTAKNNKPFLSMMVGIPGGDERKAMFWDYGAAPPKAGEHIAFDASEEIYAGNMQYSITKMNVVVFQFEDLAEFIKKSKMPVDTMWRSLLGYVEKIQNTDIRDVILSIIETYEDKIKQAPAAKGMHHDWLGGLLEHITELCGIYDSIQSRFPLVNPDKVFFGLIMHDLCKIFEYRWDRGVIEYADDGQLVPHIPRSTMLLTRAFDGLATPEPLQLELVHIVQSHHLNLEWGSSVRPKTLDALMVHYLDNLHAQMFGAIAHVEKHLGSLETFTPKHFGSGNVQLMIPKEKPPVIENPFSNDEIPF
jgi:3'-5' exoribonuclease